MTYKFENIYTSCSCNRNPNVLTWGDNGLIYYGSCNAVVVYDPKEELRVLHTCCAHTAEVRSVRWIQGHPSLPPLLVSTSSDNTAILWDIYPQERPTVKAVLKGHDGAVTAAHGWQFTSESGDPTILVATTSVDFSVKIWKWTASSGPEFVCVQTLRAGSGFCLDLKLHALPGSRDLPLLLLAMDDFKVGLYVWEKDIFERREVLVGHEDWVCSLDVTTLDDGNVMVASGSQDTYVRLWRLATSDSSPNRSVQDLAPTEEIKPEEKKFSAQGRNFSLKLESVLQGHSAWVFSVAWHPFLPSTEDPTRGHQPLTLLSSSMDASVCLWEPDTETGIWSPLSRLGLLKEDSLGVHGCVWGPSGDSVLAHTFQGSLHRWNKNGSLWTNGFTVGGGHFGEVRDIAWEPQGSFLFSVSSDQSTRIHAPWVRGSEQKDIWHELFRPQVHGYDLTCIAPLSSFRFSSGAEEKIIRCFEAPGQFHVCLKQLCKANVSDELLKDATWPQAADVPVLGLSNLSITDSRQDDKAHLHQGIENVTEPLREEVLWRSTLWPEERKLYGHGYEVYCLAASHRGHLLASACRATLPEHAAIILWDTNTWQELQRLLSHQLTVTQMAFSPNDKHLLSVSRDRRLSVFQQQTPLEESAAPQFSLLFSTDKRTGIHTRIIWTCTWTPDSLYFATGSREGCVVVWGVSPEGGYAPQSAPLSLSQSVTALAFALNAQPYLLAVGLEDGTIMLYEWRPLQGEGESWKKCTEITKHAAHHKSVLRLAFRPHQSSLQLASCSADHAIKVYNLLPVTT